jgi:cobalt-zinc-cadmium efflux system membrane fusion protein
MGGAGQRVAAPNQENEPGDASLSERSDGGATKHREASSLTNGGESGASAKLPVIRLASVESVRKAGILCAAVQEREMDEYVTSYGIVAYDETRLAQLSPRVPGIAARVEKEVGDHVLKGDLLAIIDSLDVGRAKAAFLQADVNYNLKQLNLKQLKSIANSVAERQLREAEADVREARVQRFNAQQALINLGLPITLSEIVGISDEDLARRIQFLGLPPNVAAEYNPENASANLLPLLSPLEGMVIRRELVTGEVVDPSQAQFVVADVRNMWLKLNVGKEDTMRLAIGQEVFFSADGLPGEVPSKLSWIGTEVDEKTRKVPVRAAIENRSLDGDETGYVTGQWLLRANMFGTGRIRIRERPTALVVPSTAVQWDGAHHLVFVPQGDGASFQPRRVRLGVTRDGYSEIRDGALLGEQVVSAGSYVLKSELMGVDE